jgi:DNA-binding transcriptional ArsR family regulator
VHATLSDMTTRQITDSRVLAALAHPLRRRLIDVLRVEGPGTVSALAGHTDQAVGNISHHVRVLAECGLIEEAPELARDRREHWWRITSQSLRWSTSDFGGDPAEEAIARAATSLDLERQIAFVRAFRAAGQDTRERWQDASFSCDSWLRMTPGELRELRDQITVLLRAWSDRELPDDGQTRENVFVFSHGVPAKP